MRSQIALAGRSAALLLLASTALLTGFGPRPPAGDIDGSVRDVTGNPIASAQVVVVGTTFTALSGRDGRYRIAGVPDGLYILRASATGYESREYPGVRVRTGESTSIAIRLSPVARRNEQEASKHAKPESRATDAAAPVGGLMARERDARVYLHVSPCQACPRRDFNTEDYHHRIDNRFLTVAANPLSTFAIDVDAASYANVRRFLTQGQLPPADAVRIEELINYFSYDYPAPDRNEPFGITTAQMPAPWAADHQLVLIGIQGRKIPVEKLPPSNLVFLIDVSGSMNSPDKLPLVQRAFRLLVQQLREEDRVAIVVYAGAAGLVLPSTPGDRKDEILAAIDRLQAGGSTAGGAGIKLAYDIAQQSHMKGGNNRVILATDGDFNVGVSSEGELVRLVEARKQEGSYLTVLGFGTGNLKDSRMEALADKGNGHYAYVDDIMEARKVFVEELGATLVTIAKDVKIQVEFNPTEVKEYRLIGYENRMLAAEDFNDDKKDGGELGAGHSVTALYEVIPVGANGTGGKVDDLKYRAQGRDGEPGAGEVLTVKLRWQHPTEAGPSRLVSRTVRTARSNGNLANLKFASAVAQFGMLLRNSEYKGSSNWESVRALARQGMGEDEGGYRSEFVRLVELARTLSGGEREVGTRE